MNRLKIPLVFMILISMLAPLAVASPLSMVMELETNLTTKIKGIIQPVDPDVIVIVNVTPRRLNTKLPVAGVETFGFFVTEATGRVEESDVESIRVNIYSSLDSFPPEISKIVEASVKPYTKKGQVQIEKIDAVSSEVMKKRSEVSKVQADSLQKISMEYSEHLYRLVYILAGSVGAVMFLMTLLMSGVLRSSMKQISTKVGEIKLEASGMNDSRALPPVQAEVVQNDRPALPGGGASGPRIDDMSVDSLLALLSDAYWCEKDGYANWLWSQLSPGKKAELLTKWQNLAPYASHFGRGDSREANYHNDPYYLKPSRIEMVSNHDLMNMLSDNKFLWGAISGLRKENLKMSLRERIEYSKMGTDATALAVPSKVSSPRRLPMQLQVTELSEEDESLLYAEPHLIAPEVAQKLPSLVWVALLPRDERTKIVGALSAQALAECWVGPKEVLNEIRSVLPEKRAALFGEYLAKTKPRRSSPWLKSLTDAAIPVLKTNWPQAQDEAA